MSNFEIAPINSVTEVNKFDSDICTYLFNTRYNAMTTPTLPLGYKATEEKINNKFYSLHLFPNGHESCELLAEYDENHQITSAAICSGYIYRQIGTGTYISQIAKQDKIVGLLATPIDNEDYWSDLYNAIYEIESFARFETLCQLQMLTEINLGNLPLEEEQFLRQYLNYCEALATIRRARINASEFGLKLKRF